MKILWGKKILIWSYRTELVTGKYLADVKISLQFLVHIIQTEKRAGHCSMVRFKEKCPPRRIDCPLGRKPGGSTRAEEKPLRDTTCRLRGKGLDMPCDSYWGWLSRFYWTLSHFVSFKNRNHWPLIWKLPQIVFRPRRNMHQVGFGRKREVFSMKEIHARTTFPVWLRKKWLL